MRRLLVLAVLLAAGCGGSSERSGEAVVRAWSTAINANDNEAAADLFADDAKVVQGGELTLATHDDAVAWNAMLPCAGHLESIHRRGVDYVAVFALGERPRHACDAPGQEAAGIFRVRHGKIVLWHQTEVPSDSGDVV